MIRIKSLIYLLLLSHLFSCGVFKKIAPDDFPEGRYRMPAKQQYFSLAKDSVQIMATEKPGYIFLYNENDTIWFAPLPGTPGELPANYLYPFSSPGKHTLKLRKTSFDFDVFTTPFKYRPAIAGLPAQMNASFNGSIYLGYRVDQYSVKSSRLFNRVQREKTQKIGYGLGGFVGVGSAFINPTFMRNAIDYEYDAFVIDYGAAFLVGYRNISTGIAVGFDFLTDKNRGNWVYQHKPWIGIFIGLNLN